MTQSKLHLRRGIALLMAPLIALSMLLAAFGFVQQTAYSKGAAPAAEAGSVESPTAECDPANPLPGQTARLFGDDEIMLSYRFSGDPRSLKSMVINQVNQSLVSDSSLNRDYGSMSDMVEVWWVAAAAADYTGDGHAELVTAFQNHSKHIAGTSTQFDSTIPFPYMWSDSSDRTTGDGVDDVDVAAGNLDPADSKDEVVIAFRDDAEDIHLKVFDEYSGTTPILKGVLMQTADLYYDTKERGNVHHVAVDVGDIDGDGADEIVTSFKDSGSDLQILIFKYQRTSATAGTLQLVSEYDSYDTTDNYAQWNTVADACNNWGNKRPIDVTTGDLDGDMQDEVITGFRLGSCDDGYAELLVTDYISTTTSTTGTTLNMDHRVTKKVDLPSGHSEQTAQAMINVSLSAADLDGDGYDEIAMGFTELWGGEYDPIRWQTWLWTFEYLRAWSPEWTAPCGANNPAQLSCITQRSGSWSSGSTSFSITTNETGPQAEVVIATGDLDQDGKDEIVLGRNVPSNGDVDLFSIEADSGLVQSGFYKIDSGDNGVWDFWLAMGDQDGNSVWGTYAGSCHAESDAMIQAVIHAPPFWPEDRGLNGYANEFRTKAGFGKNVGGGGGSGESAETTISGSATLGFSIPKVDIGPSFTSEWEHTTFQETQVLTSTRQGVGTETTPLCCVNAKENEAPSYGNTMLIDSINWCYDYTAPGWETIPVCVPQPTLTTVTSKKLSWWYEFGPETYTDTWTPLGMNLAQGRTASQSTTYTAETPTGDASRAVDGVTEGDYYKGSVARTTHEDHSWWQLDLGGVQWIDGILLWNRSDCCTGELSNYYVFVTDKSSFSSNDPDVLLNDPDVWHYPENGLPESEAAGRPTIIPVSEYGRLVRVQLAGHNYLNLAEVQVFGMPGTPDQWPIVAPTEGANNFTLTWRGNRQQIVNGKVYYIYHTPYIRTGQGSDDLTFDLGAGKDQENVEGSGYSAKFSAGMEMKMKGGSESYEAAWGNSWRQSNVVTWSTEVEFSGVATGLDDYAPLALGYTWAPYVWYQEVPMSGGGKQKFLVLDYFVPDAQVITPSSAPDALPAAETILSSPPVTPTIPMIDSPTHPDPSAWYTADTAVFDWAQSPGDPATVETYHWFLDQTPDTIPWGLHLGLTNTATYEKLRDGVWYLHVRAMSDTGNWGETGHRMIRVDANPPVVSLKVDPPWPSGDGGWYVTPLTVTATADDGSGSGVASLEISTDGVTWQPYVAPWTFSADTAGKTIYARAADAIGNVSDPVSVDFKIDQTAPDSHVSGGDGPGAIVAEVYTNSAGNEALRLAGAIADSLSGRAGMDLGVDGYEWTSASGVGAWYPFPDPTIEVNWYYTATHRLGAGYHLFTGRAFDAAGNQEAPYEIARVLWLPKASPDISGSGIIASQSVARPGDEVAFVLTARNGGFQEAHVAISTVLPAGLTLTTDGAASDMVYDPATRTLTWPAKLLWPGQWEHVAFKAGVDAGVGAVSLENLATFHAFWPNTDLLPPAEKQQFLDREQTVKAMATVTVKPTLLASADLKAPWVVLVPPEPRAVTGPAATLGIITETDAHWMYLREWAPDPSTGDWVVKKDSGWIPYSRKIDWTLSAGQGVKYLGVWVADSAGNVSALSEFSLASVNRIDGPQVLADGQRIQYRGYLQGGERISFLLKTVSGDPDLFGWTPRNAFWPDRYIVETVLPGQFEQGSNQFPLEGGRYLLEVGAVGDSEYELDLNGQGGVTTLNSLAPLKTLPAHPLTVSDPLSAGQVGPAVGAPPPLMIYLPIVSRH